MNEVRPSVGTAQIPTSRGSFTRSSESNVMNEGRVTAFLIFMIFTLIIGSFVYGYNISAINIPELKIHGPSNSTDEGWMNFPPSIPMNTAIWGLAVAMLTVGGLVGSIIGGSLAGFFGRKLLVIISDVLFVGAGLLMSLAIDPTMFIIGRFVVGIPCGISTSVVPVYLSEISPTSVRGIIGTTFQAALSVGLLVSTILSLPLDSFKGWRILIGLSIIPSVIQLILAFFVVESPEWLLLKGKSNRARRYIERLRGLKKGALSLGPPLYMGQNIESLDSKKAATTTSNEDFFTKTPPAQPFPDSSTKESKTSTMGLKEFFKTPSLVRALFVGIIVHLNQQFTGANAIFFYSTKTFQVAYGDDSKYITLGVVIVNLIAVIISAFIVDRLGRRLLLLIGQSVMCVSLIILTLGFVFKVYPLLIIFVFIYIFFYSATAGAITWILTGELFPTRAMAIASSIVVSVNWISNFIVGMGFPLISDALGNYSFIPFVVLLAIFFVLTLIFVPETKGKTIDEITMEFERVTSH